MGAAITSFTTGFGSTTDTTPSTISAPVHWTKMEAFHQQIAELQRQEGVRVIKPPHALGFLDPDLPKRGQSAGQPSEAIS